MWSDVERCVFEKSIENFYRDSMPVFWKCFILESNRKQKKILRLLSYHISIWIINLSGLNGKMYYCVVTFIPSILVSCESRMRGMENNWEVKWTYVERGVITTVSRLKGRRGVDINRVKIVNFYKEWWTRTDHGSIHILRIYRNREFLRRITLSRINVSFFYITEKYLIVDSRVLF